jgi:16S rRNA pseudouridine516 synthase
MLIRIDKILSSTGEYSRSEAKTLIKRGLVTVDGRIAASGDEKADPRRATSG